MEPSPSRPRDTIAVTVNVSAPLFDNVRTWLVDRPNRVGGKRTVFGMPSQFMKQSQEMFRIAFLVGGGGVVGVGVGAVVDVVFGPPPHPTRSSPPTMVATSPTPSARACRLMFIVFPVELGTSYTPFQI